eukprot:342470-Pelagomonas_calceolata.AAC.1
MALVSGRGASTIGKSPVRNYPGDSFSYHPRDLNSRKFTYHHWCALPTKNVHITYSPYILPKYFYLDLPKHVVRSVACFCLRVHTLKVEQASWDHHDGTIPVTS